MKKIFKFFIILIIIIFSFNVNAKESDVVYPSKDSNNVLFEGVGKYAFATAGNNLVYRGSSYELSGEAPNGNGKVGIFPTNKDEVLSWLPSELSSKINNLSGSKLEYSGKVIQGTLNMMKLCTAEVGCPVPYDVLVIYPDHSYNIYKGADSNHSIYDIEIKGEGWYYVSILVDENKLFNQDAWAINVIYENQSLPVRYMKLINPSYDLNTGESVEIKFDSKLNLTDDFQLYGIIVGAGINAWHDLETRPSLDTLEAILDDGTYKKLYETEYNGKKVFEGRLENDFARTVFSTIRNPEGEDTWGGELDIFNETLSKDFFDNKSIIGYRFYKGYDWYRINLIGLAQAIEIPEYTINAEIKKVDKDIIENKIVIKNISNYSSCSTQLTIPYDDYIKEIKKDDIKVSPTVSKDNITIDNTNKQIIIKFDEIVPKGTEYTVTYNSKVDETKDYEVKLDPTLTYFPANGTTCLIDIISNEVYRYSVSAHDMNKNVATKLSSIDDASKTVVEVENTSLNATEGLVIGVMLILAGTSIIIININNKAKIKLQ